MEQRESPKEAAVKNPFFEEPDIISLIERTQMKDEDLPLLEELATMPKEELLNFHNFFNLSREESADILKHQIDKAKNSALSRYLEILLHFAENYHYMFCFSIERILEKRNQNQ